MQNLKGSLCRLQHCAPDDWDKGWEATRNPVLCLIISDSLSSCISFFSICRQASFVSLCIWPLSSPQVDITSVPNTHTLLKFRKLNRISRERQLLSQALVNIHHWYSESNAGLTPQHLGLFISILVLILALLLRLKPSWSLIFFWSYLWGSITTPVHESYQAPFPPGVQHQSSDSCHSSFTAKALVCPFLPLLLALLA